MKYRLAYFLIFIALGSCAVPSNPVKSSTAGTIDHSTKSNSRVITEVDSNYGVEKPKTTRVAAPTSRTDIGLQFGHLLSGRSINKNITYISSDHILTELGNITKHLTGSDSALRHLRKIQKSIHNLRISPKRVIETKRLVMVQGILSGTHAGTFLGIKPTKKVIQTEVVYISWLQDGKIRQTLFHLNSDDIFKQLSITGNRRVSQSRVPDKYETIRGKSTKVTNKITSQLYGAASVAMIIELSKLSRDPKFGSFLQGEHAFSELVGLRPLIKPYAMKLAHVAISAEDTFSAGSYVVTRFKTGLKKNVINQRNKKKYGNLSRNIILVANTSQGKLSNVQFYIGDKALRQ